MSERPPAVAGRFYPRDPGELAHLVDGLLAAAPAVAPAGRLRAVIVPHAGLVYSGAVAATAYRQIDPSVQRVLLLGPDHYVGTAGMAVPAVDRLGTPLGAVPVDDALWSRAVTAPACGVDDRPHRAEHSLEVQLPFLLRRLRPGWTLLPVVVGPTPEAQVATLIGEVLDDDVLLVVSSDLSHYLDDATARERDRRTAATVVAREGDALEPGDACGIYPLRGALAVAAARGWHVRLDDLRTSADTAGSPERVVGYGAFSLWEEV